MTALQKKVAIFLAFIGAATCNTCYYLKFTPMHSYCRPPNPTCRLLSKGVTNEDKNLIVSLHNEYRNKVATGRERHAGHLPTAANMMQMVWDNELAAIAQKHAEQCKYKHDCNECRQVDRFQVNQNAFRHKISSMPGATNWPKMMEQFYNEVSIFNKKHIKPYVFDLSYGHFSQIVWATSWRVGCGRAVYKEDEWYYTFLVCNYGPTGNISEGEMYKVGPPCSACPKGTCCGSSCRRSKRPPEYNGLCKAINPNTFRI